MHLVELIQPITRDEFFSRYLEKEYFFLSRNNPGLFSSLFSLKDLDYLLGHFPKETRIKIADSTKDPEHHTSLVEVNVSQLSSLYENFYQGGTLIVDGLHNLWEPVNRLCRNLVVDTGMQTQANMYITPRGSTGFSSHWDGHDVMILQLEGEKNWKLFDSGPILPRPESPGGAYENDEEPSQRITMQPGDVLYLPRGTPHQATAANEPSVHLTIGLMPMTWEHLLLAAVRKLSEDNESLRKSVPQGWLSDSDTLEPFLDSYRELAKELLSENNLETALEYLGIEFLERTPSLPDGHFAQINLVDRINLDTVVEKRSRDLLRIANTDEGSVLIFPGGSLGGPSKLSWAFAFMAETDHFKVSEIPGWYSDEERLMLVKNLVRRGFLRIVTQNESKVTKGGDL